MSALESRRSTDPAGPSEERDLDKRDIDLSFENPAQCSFDDMDTALMEAKLRRKIDLHILPVVMILWTSAVIDRANIGNARLAGFENQLNLKGYDYNIILSLFYVSYIVFEIPSTICNKVVGPGKWIPFLTILFGVLSISMAFVRSLASAAIVRFLLGIAEAGMLPGIAFYLSRWYRKRELGSRIACYLCCSSLSGAFGGLLASAILELHSIGSVHKWQMLFLVEGIVTICIGIGGYLLLTDTIDSARWLTPREKDLANWRVRIENVGQPHIVDSLRSRSVWEGATQISTLVIALIFLFNNITVQGNAVFTPTIVATLFPGRSVVEQQLLTVPPYFAGFIATLANPFLSDRYGNRCFFIAIPAIVLVMGYTLLLASHDPHVRYGGSHLAMIGSGAMGPLIPTWVSVNAVSDSARAGALGTVVLAGNCGGLIATWSYLSRDAPDYVPGNALNAAAGTAILLLASSLGAYLRLQNARKDARMSTAGGIDDKAGLTKEEEHLGHRHPRFRYHS